MFSTFTTKEGDTLIVRSQDIRQMRSVGGERTLLCWEVCGTDRYQEIQDTPAENLARIAREEPDAVMQAQARQQRQTNGLPIVPIQRGRR